MENIDKIVVLLNELNNDEIEQVHAALAQKIYNLNSDSSFNEPLTEIELDFLKSTFKRKRP